MKACLLAVILIVSTMQFGAPTPEAEARSCWVTDNQKLSFTVNADPDGATPSQQITTGTLGYTTCYNGSHSLIGEVTLTYDSVGINTVNGEWEVKGRYGGEQVVVHPIKLDTKGVTLRISNCMKNATNQAAKDFINILPISTPSAAGDTAVNVGKLFLTEVIPKDNTRCVNSHNVLIPLRINGRGYFDGGSHTRSYPLRPHERWKGVEISATVKPTTFGKHNPEAPPRLITHLNTSADGVWFIDNVDSRNRYFVVPDCAISLNRFVTKRVGYHQIEQYNKFASWDEGWRSCQFFTEKVKPVTKPRFVYPEGKSGYDGWFLEEFEGKPMRQYIDSTCVQQLGVGGNDPQSLPWDVIEQLHTERSEQWYLGRKFNDYSRYIGCDEVQVKLSGMPGWGFYTAQGVNSNESWVHVANRYYYVSGFCRVGVLSLGLPLQTVPYSDITAITKGSESTDCQWLIDQLKAHFRL